MFVIGVDGRRFRPMVVLATIVPATFFYQGDTSMVRADNAESSTNSTHSASSGGEGTSTAGGGANESSSASADSDNANGNAVVTVGSAASQLGKRGNSAATADVKSNASASSGISGNSANAEAYVTLTGGAQQASANANGSNTSGAGATATNGAIPRASAYTTNGGYATAEAGGNALAFQPGAGANTYRRGTTTVVIAYTDQGSFSMAISDSGTARAVAGTTNETVALSKGQIRAILKSSTYAEAYADRDFAWAEAWAEGEAESGTDQGFSRASGYSYASARANRNGDFISVDAHTSRYENGNKQFEHRCSKRSNAKRRLSCDSPAGNFKLSSHDSAALAVPQQQRRKSKRVAVVNHFSNNDDISSIPQRITKQRGKKIKTAVASGRNKNKGEFFGLKVKQTSAFAVAPPRPAKKRWASVGDFIDKSDMPVARTAKHKHKKSIKVVKASKKIKRTFSFEDL